MLNNVLFKGNRIYSHPLLQVNYTTYNLRCESDTVNPCINHRDIMLLAPTDRSTCHPFCYTRVLGIFHANVVFVGSESSDYQSRHLEFLWVRWFELVEAPAGGRDDYSLDKGKFMPMDLPDAYGFVDPVDVLRCCQLIPAFADRRLRPDGSAVSQSAASGDGNDWKYYYINR
ncbi:hypothetical protein BU15DRAFT_47505 [Melanogaster broomeanus]|nr:hypothetical protein BU15DRAFT_47505 [Melanogaster broomeanus]